MNKGEINPNIRRLDPQELTIQSRLGDADLQSVYTLYVAALGGRKVVVKPSSAHIQEEANALFLLQGVNCVPELYGILSSQMRTPSGDVLPPGAIVEEFATGQDLTRAYVHYPTFRYVGYNPEPEIMSQLVAHFRESVKKGLLVQDFKSGELFLDFRPDAKPKLIRVDYDSIDYVVDKPDKACGEYFIGNITSRLLFLAERGGGEFPPLDLDFYDPKRRDRSDTLGRLKNASQRLRTNGETSLPSLIDDCAKGDFATTDINTFYQFLNKLEEAAIDHGRFVSEGALNQRQKDLELILASAQRGGGATNIGEALDYMRKANSYNALILADKLGRVPDNLRVAIDAGDDNYLKALVVLIDRKYAPKPLTNQPSQPKTNQPPQRKGFFGGLFNR